MDKDSKKIFERAEKRMVGDMNRDIIRLEAENRILKEILEQKLEITLIPKFKDAFAQRGKDE